MYGDYARSGELAWALFRRSLRSQYRQTLLGYGWLLIPPLATTLTFLALQRANIVNPGANAAGYAAFVMTGAVLWQGFTDALGSPLRVIRSAISMLASVNFPREALVVGGLMEVLFSLGVRVAFLLIALVAMGSPPSWATPLSVGAIAALVLLGWMVGLLLVPAGILFRDVELGLPIITTVWFFITPVAYNLPSEGLLSMVGRLNPVTPLLVLGRDLILRGETAHVTAAVPALAATLGLAFAVSVLFRITIPHVVKRLPG
jgi:lipopolysaccharide transport system permease protein